jgi:hypothetical protein
MPRAVIHIGHRTNTLGDRQAHQRFEPFAALHMALPEDRFPELSVHEG